jgi:NTP pyrophosphatase (non-canonical NTP hydrolase)
MCGEAGETANICKKLKRADDNVRGNEFSDHPLSSAQVDVLYEKLSDECADTFLYLLLVAERCGLDLERAVVRRFNDKSAEMGFPQRLF